MTTLTVKATDILVLTENQIWEYQNTKTMHLQCHDGVVLISGRHLILSWYMWEFHRVYPDTQLLTSHVIPAFKSTEELPKEIKEKYYGDQKYVSQPFTSGINLKVLNTIYQSTLNSNPGVAIDHLNLLTMQVTNRIYNEMSSRLGEYVVSLNALDFIEIMDDEEVVEANAQVEYNHTSIDEAYKILNRVLEYKPSLAKNGLAEPARCKVINTDQCIQLIGPRGFAADFDSTLFRYPIITGYLEGMQSLYQSMIESRSSTIAQLYNKKPLEDTEYFNRRIQMLMSVVQNLHDGDCGTDLYLEIMLRENDLRHFNGKYYIEEDGSLSEITPDRLDLVGRVLKIRSILQCKHSDPVGVCKTCLGAMSMSVPDGSNLGHIASIAIGEKMTQNIMSTKHLLRNIKTEVFQLVEGTDQYLKPVNNGDHLALLGSLKGERITVEVPLKHCPEINTIHRIRNLSSINPQRVTSLETIKITVTTGDVSYTDLLYVKRGTRNACFSKEFLTYVRENPWGTNEKGELVFDITNFPRGEHFIDLPMTHSNPLDFLKSSASIIESKKVVKPDQPLCSFTDKASALTYVLDRLNTKLDVNVAWVEVLLLASTARDAANRDYRIAKGDDNFTFHRHEELMKYRSVSAVMAYQRHKQFFESYANFLDIPRSDHPYDSLYGNCEL